MAKLIQIDYDTWVNPENVCRVTKDYNGCTIYTTDGGGYRTNKSIYTVVDSINSATDEETEEDDEEF